MLVLTRKVGEKLVLQHAGVTITIDVLKCEHGRIKLGITAPTEVKACREELLHNRSKKDRRRQGVSGRASGLQQP